jgi:hypothetical protein
MRMWSLLTVGVVALLWSAEVHAALGPGTAPPGVTASAWNQMAGRAEWVAESVAKLAPNANKACVYAVVLELLGAHEVGLSQDVSGRGLDTPRLRRTVAKGHETSFSDALKKNVDDQCGGGGGGLAETLRGVLRFAAEQAEWDIANYDALKRDVSRAVEMLVKLGVIMPAAEGAAAATGTISLPVLDPALFMPKKHDPLDGT